MTIYPNIYIFQEYPAKEQRHLTQFFFFLPFLSLSMSVADDCCEVALHALDILFNDDTLSVDWWRVKPLVDSQPSEPGAKWKKIHLIWVVNSCHMRHPLGSQWLIVRILLLVKWCRCSHNRFCCIKKLRLFLTIVFSAVYRVLLPIAFFSQKTNFRMYNWMSAFDCGSV